jgi:Kef-type K+ transport system membrane component KefB
MILAAASDHGTQVLLSLFIMLAAAKLFAELFERLRQPAVVGEILAGIVIGPSVLGWVSPSAITSVLAEIGVIFLLFTVGLETKPAAIFRVGKSALVVAVLGVVVPLLAGWALMRAWGGLQVEALFVGTALVATSVGITARVLSACGVLGAPSSRIILGAAVIDDILGLLVLAVVASMAAGQINYLEIATTSALALAFTAFLAFVGAPVLTRLRPRLERLRVGHAFFVTSLILCLGLSLAATYIGVAAIIGAFLAGMALAEATESNHTLHDQTSGITELFVPFFLTSIGMQLKLDIFSDPKTLTLAILVTITALLTKIVGCGAGALHLGWRQAAQVGVGMMPRGEVGIVVAQIGLSLGVIGDSLFGVVLFMAVVTTLIAPPLLKILFASQTPGSNGSELSRIA